MADRPISGVTEVAACTVAAVHRRDHEHGGAGDCHPHVVEVVRLGDNATAVCHDCRLDSGFLLRHEAEELAAIHRRLTETDDVRLAV